MLATSITRLEVNHARLWSAPLRAHGATRLAIVGALALGLLALSPRGVMAHHAESGCPELIIESFGERAHQACNVAYCETGGTWDQDATGRAGERGWFQIHPIHGPNLSSYDPETNVMAAMTLSRDGTNWGPWSCRP